MDDRPSLSARDYVESLHQNSRATLLYGKNNVLVQPVSTCWGSCPLKCSAPRLSQAHLMEESTGSFLTWEGSDWTGFVGVLPSGTEELCFCLSTNRLLACPLVTRGHKCLLLSLPAYCSQVRCKWLMWSCCASGSSPAFAGGVLVALRKVLQGPSGFLTQNPELLRGIELLSLWYPGVVGAWCCWHLPARSHQLLLSLCFSSEMTWRRSRGICPFTRLQTSWH